MRRIATFNEPQIDGTIYTDVTAFAQNTLAQCTDAASGWALFAVFIITAWWTTPDDRAAVPDLAGAIRLSLSVVLP